MLHHRLRPVTRRASDEFGPPPAAVHHSVLSVLSDGMSLHAWGALKAGAHVCVDEITQYLPAEARR